MSNFFRLYLLPGILFQSVIISGGYTTGRELIEFFMKTGPMNGFLGMFVSMLFWSCILAVTYEYARVHQAYDYRKFFKSLLNRYWILFEITYLICALIALSIISAAAGAIFQDMTGLPQAIGSVLMIVGIGILVFFGTELIEKVFSFWSFVLYAAYISLFAIAYYRVGMDTSPLYASQSDYTTALHNGARYGGINLAAAPAILFGLAHLRTRKQAIWAGILSGPIAIIPAVLFYCALLNYYPDIVKDDLPLLVLLSSLKIASFTILFQLVIFGTYIESGTALIHTINERLAGLRKDKHRSMPSSLRVVVALVFLMTSVFLAINVGLTDLIAKGFGTLTYFAIAIYVVPLLTIGIIHIKSSATG